MRDSLCGVVAKSVEEAIVRVKPCLVWLFSRASLDEPKPFMAPPKWLRLLFFTEK